MLFLSKLNIDITNLKMKESVRYSSIINKVDSVPQITVRSIFLYNNIKIKQALNAAVDYHVISQIVTNVKAFNLPILA